MPQYYKNWINPISPIHFLKMYLKKSQYRLLCHVVLRCWIGVTIDPLFFGLKMISPFYPDLISVASLYVVATALQPGQTDFFNHALFVPVMYRIASSSIRNESKLYYTLRESFIQLRADSLQGEEPLRWVGEEEIVPAQRKLSDEVIFDLPKFSIVKGFYKIVANRDTVSLLAFNLDKAESLLDQYTGEEMKDLLGSGDRITIFKVGAQEAFSNEIKERYLGTPLWKYALLLAMFFLLMEILLIRFLK